MKAPPAYNLRLPIPLKVNLCKAAIENHRSLNAEIIARLERSFSEYRTSLER